MENPGPIQMLTLAFPGNMFKGEILPELDRLKGEGLIRVIDMMIVRKDPQGNVMVATATDLDFDEATALGSYLGALAGFAYAGAEGVERGAIAGAAELADGHIFDEDDVFRVSQALNPDTTAAAVLIEHIWARDIFEKVENAHGVELMNEWLPLEKVLQMGPTTFERQKTPGGADPEPDSESDSES